MVVYSKKRKRKRKEKKAGVLVHVEYSSLTYIHDPLIKRLLLGVRNYLPLTVYYESRENRELLTLNHLLLRSREVESSPSSPIGTVKGVRPNSRSTGVTIVPPEENKQSEGMKRCLKGD